MKNYLKITLNKQFKMLVMFVIGALSFTSCDVYELDNKEPDWLGGSIYEYLYDDGHFTNFVKLIDDLNYSEVLKLTGSKTLFVANDSAFNEFYKNNEWGVTKYDDLTRSQKIILLNYSMVNNAYVMNVFSNYYSDGILNEGTAMRRHTALSDIDSIPHVYGDQIPEGKFWNAYKSKGIYLINDVSLVKQRNNDKIPMVFFSQNFLNKYSLTAEDFALLTGGLTRTADDIHIFNSRVIKKDIVCKNGYINVLDRVLLPPSNMAEYISKNPSTKIFSKLLDRFAIPVYDEANTLLYRQLYDNFTDSIFSKMYLASIGGTNRLPNGMTAPNLLAFNPGWNCYVSTALQADMAAMFVPSDDAMNAYFNSGVGEILKSRFHTWDSVPDEIILSFVKRHMRPSLIESVPSKFSKMVDAENYALPVTKAHINGSYTSVNGEVYITNEVYPPVDYISVYSPVLFSSNSKIMNWAINISETSVDGTPFAFYKLYLNSLVSKYSLFIPTDEYFNSYIDPIAYGQTVPGVLKFWYNTLTNSVNATVYKYDKTSGTVGDSVDVITSSAFLKNRLWNIMDSHIVVGDVESGKDYYITKANDIIKVSGSGNNLVVKGGGDLARGTQSNVTKYFNQYNGNTYFLDKPIQSALTSVYTKLKNTPEFSKFFDLLSNVPDTCIQQIFTIQGIDSRVKFFNAYRYTIYVPTNDAIDAAIISGKIKTWDAISNMSPGDARNTEISKMIKILKYHFQDNAVFAKQSVNNNYQSATIKTDNTSTYLGTAKNKYYKIKVVGDGNTLTLTADTKSGQAVQTAKVVTTGGLYDIVVKDYIFGKVPTTGYKNIDNTGAISGTAFNTSTITTSASAVIHQIDNVLTLE